MSSISDVSMRWHVAAGDEMWAVERAANPGGSFALFRNTSQSENGAALQLALGKREGAVLAPRETVTWHCDLLAEHAEVTVRTPTGALVYQAAINCGDAVYLKRLPRTAARGSTPTSHMVPSR